MRKSNVKGINQSFSQISVTGRCKTGQVSGCTLTYYQIGGKLTRNMRPEKSLHCRTDSETALKFSTQGYAPSHLVTLPRLHYITTLHMTYTLHITTFQYITLLFATLQ